MEKLNKKKVAIIIIAALVIIATITTVVILIGKAKNKNNPYANVKGKRYRTKIQRRR